MSTESSAGGTRGNGSSPGAARQTDGESTEELWQIIEEQQRAIDRMQDRIEHLEAKVDDVEFEADSVQQVADQLASGKIGGDAGADFIQGFMEVPDHSTLIDARSTNLFLQIIRDRMVSAPVTTARVVKWFDLGDSANPSVQAKRIMERVKENREAGFYIGDVELGKHRGQNCIWLNRQ